MSTIIPILLLALAIIGSISVTNTYASDKSPYRSGYDYGCDDADQPVKDRYINEPGKGPSYHTDEFMSGYREGFDDCKSGESAYSQDTSDFPELEEGKKYGGCEQQSKGLACDIIDDNDNKTGD